VGRFSSRHFIFRQTLYEAGNAGPPGTSLSLASQTLTIADFSLPKLFHAEAICRLPAFRPFYCIILLVLLNIFAGLGCDSWFKKSGFRCGTQFASDPGIVVTCARPREVCLCSTNSCALPVSASDAGCPSGFRYAEYPYVSTGVAENSCVPPDDLGSTVRPEDTNKLCPGISGSPTTDGATLDVLDASDNEASADDGSLDADIVSDGQDEP
jgi:hypothetical protein